MSHVRLPRWARVFGACSRPSSFDARPKTSITHLVSVDIARVEEGLFDGLVHRLVRSVLHGTRKEHDERVFLAAPSFFPTSYDLDLVWDAFQ